MLVKISKFKCIEEWNFLMLNSGIRSQNHYPPVHTQLQQPTWILPFCPKIPLSQGTPCSRRSIACLWHASEAHQSAARSYGIVSITVSMWVKVRRHQGAVHLFGWSIQLTALSPAGDRDRLMGQLLTSCQLAQGSKRERQRMVSLGAQTEAFSQTQRLHWGLKLYREISATPKVISALSINWVSSSTWQYFFAGFVLVCVCLWEQRGKKLDHSASLAWSVSAVKAY